MGDRPVVLGAEETVPGRPTVNIYRGMGLEAAEKHEDRDCELKREARRLGRWSSSKPLLINFDLARPRRG